MPNNRFLCPECEATLRVSGPLPDGNVIRCPKCNSAILLPPEEGDSDEEEKQPRLANAVNTPAHRSTVARRPVREVEEKEDEEEEDRPRRRRRRPRPKSKRGILLASLLCGGAGLALLIGIIAWQVSNYVSTRPSTPTPVSASESTYVLRIKTDPEVGKSIREQIRAKVLVVSEFHDLNGKRLNSNKVEVVHEIDQTMSTLALDDRGATRFILDFEKAFEQVGRQKTPRSYQGRRLLIEQQVNGPFKATALGKPDLPGADLEKLAAQIPHDRERHLVNGMLRAKPVKVNDTWNLDTQKLADSFNLEGNFEMASNQGKAKLTKTFQKEGKQWGVIEFEYQLTVQRIEQFRLDPPAILDLKVTYEGVIDGSDTKATLRSTGKMKVNSKTEEEGIPLTIEMDRDFSVTTIRSAEFDTPPDRIAEPPPNDRPKLIRDIHKGGPFSP